MISSSHSNNIDAKEFIERKEAGEVPYLLDVRERIEFSTYNIGGLNIPLSKLADNLSTLQWGKNDEIIVICKIGLRSETAKIILQQNGYQHVRNLEGGLMGLRRLAVGG